MGITVADRPSPELRCALCHASLPADSILRCDDCGACFHPECGVEPCPTLGCRGELAAPTRELRVVALAGLVLATILATGLSLVVEWRPWPRRRPFPVPAPPRPAAPEDLEVELLLEGSPVREQGEELDVRVLFTNNGESPMVLGLLPRHLVDTRIEVRDAAGREADLAYNVVNCFCVGGLSTWDFATIPPGLSWRSDTLLVGRLARPGTYTLTFAYELDPAWYDVHERAPDQAVSDGGDAPGTAALAARVLKVQRRSAPITVELRERAATTRPRTPS